MNNLETDIFNYKTPEFFINMKNIPDKTSTERKSFVLGEKRKCKQGININGVWIPGSLYFHLNYYHLQGDDEKTGKKAVFLPRLRDNEWIFFNDYEEAYAKRIVYPFFGLRQAGKSEMIVSLCLRELSLYKETEAMALFSSDNDKDTFVKKISTAISHGEKFIIIPNIDKDWTKNEIRFGLTKQDNTLDLRARLYIYNTQEGKKIQVGSGKSLSFLLMDEIAKSQYRGVYDVIEPALLTDYGKLRCTPLFTFTGGEADKAKDAENLIKNPIYDRQFTTTLDDGRTIGGRFLDGRYRKDCKKETTLSKYLNKTTGTWVDDYPIFASDFAEAEQKIEKERKDASESPDSNTLLLKKIFFPLTIDEVFLTESNNHFPTKEIRLQKAQLEDYTPVFVELYRDRDNKVQWRTSELSPISKFPITPKDFKDAPGCMYEPPQADVPHGTYVIGCLPPGEKVMTNSGLKNIEKVTLDDKLINENGNFVDIVNLQSYQVKGEDLYDIKVSNTFRTTKFTKEHPILVSKSFTKYVSKSKRKELGIRQRYRQFDFKYVTADKLQKGDWIKVPNTYNKVFLHNNNLEVNSNLLENKDFWWILGLWYGDGWCESDKRRVSFAFNSKEVNYINKFELVVKQLFNEDVKLTRDRGGCTELYFNCKKLNHFLTSNFGEYSYGKFMPEWIKYLNPEFKKELVRGYLNSDGCNHINKRGHCNIEFVSVNQELLEGFQDVLFSLGIVSNLNKLRNTKEITFKNNSNSSKTRVCFNLKLSNSDSLRLVKIIYDEKDHKLNKIEIDKLNRIEKRREKGCFIDESNDFIYFQITSIEKSKFTGNVYNFECDTHTFMCRHITTHNCDPYNEDSSSDKVNSLGSIYVYKRMYNPFGEYQNSIVFSWSGRKKEVKQFHELCLNVAEFYNAIEGVLPENEDKTLIQYFFFKKKGHYLADTFELAKQINPLTKTNRLKGLSASTVNQRHYMNLMYAEVKDTVITSNDKGEEVEQMGIYKIPDIMLLEEMEKYRGKTKGSKGVHDGNYDRIIAYGHALVLARYFDVKYSANRWKPTNEDEEAIKRPPKHKTPWGNYTQGQNNLFIKPKKATNPLKRMFI